MTVRWRRRNARRGRSPADAGWRRIVAAAALSAVATGCAGKVGRFGTLEDVIEGRHLASGAEIQGVRVVRGGSPVRAETSMALVKGDAIETDSDTRAVLGFSAGYEVTLGRSTGIVIVNPGILVRIGRAFLKALANTPEAFTVETGYVVAGTEGTEFLVGADGDATFTLTVVEGRVRVESRTESWPAVSYGPYEQATIRAGTPPEGTIRLTRSQLEGLLAWVADVERLTTGRVPVLVGLRLDHAMALLRERDFSAVRVRYGVTGAAAPRTVVSQRPAAESVLAAGSPIELLVETQAVLVPNLVGQTLEQARGALADAGLRLGRVQEEPSSKEAQGAVFRQSRRSGERVPPGGQVDVYVAAGVPDLIGMDAHQAARRLREVGLEVGRMSRLSDRSHTPGAVIGQSPSPGSMVRSGSAVDLVVAPAGVE